MPTAKVHRISAAAPDDVRGIEDAIIGGRIDPDGIVAIFGKTEGNGCVNDFTRGYATQSLGLMLHRFVPRERAAEVCLVMSGGTEGGMAPHWVVFERCEDSKGERPALALGQSHTAALPPEHLGRLGQVDQVAAGVRSAMAAANIESVSDVHFVQIKCPLLTAQRIAEADNRSSVAVRDTLKSMGLSRAASALGIAVALDEVQRTSLSEVAIASDFEIWSGRASCSAGIELMNHEIVVLGMSRSWSGPLAIGHAVMADGIDTEPVRAVLQGLGIPANGQLTASERKRVVAVLAKAEASHDGQLRGHRHTMLDDSDISPTRHARAFVCGALASVFGHAEIYVSGGAEHQGPDGGGPVALIVDRRL
ncbi:MAG: ring-opening amidohydrolase [Alphaproteobacteria bacterium]|nr:MAG: ring-opening amidohydrolase [Alphaproteobacteria bacterium]